MKTKKLAAVLIRSFGLGMLFLALWVNAFILWGERMYVGHSQWFGISYKEFSLMNYGAMGIMKISLIVFFLLPYLGILWARYSKKNK